MPYRFSWLNWYNRTDGQDPEAFHVVRRQLPGPARFALRWLFANDIDDTGGSGVLFSE